MPPEPPRPQSPEDGQECGMASPSPEREGYQLLGAAGLEDEWQQAPGGGLPQPDGLSSEDDVSDDEEPQSVADLMAALEQHGTNTVETDDAVEPDAAATGAAPDLGPAATDTTTDRSNWPEGAAEAERQRQKEAARERLALYGSGAASGQADPLAPDEAEAVQRAMRSVRLPAAEQWARGLSEQQWRRQLERLLGRPAGDPPPPPSQDGPPP